MARNVYESIYDEHINRGKCLSCGFLSKQSPFFPHLGKFEVPWHERQAGTLFDHYPQGNPGVEKPVITVPVCAKGFRHFSLLMRDMDGEEPDKLKRLLVEPIDCEGWAEYDTTVGPQEMLDRAALLKLEQERRAFEVMLHARSEDTQKGMMKIANRQLGLSVAAIIIGVFATFLAGRCTTANFSFSGDPVPVIIQTPSPPAADAPTLTQIPSPESIPGTEEPQPQQAP